MYNQFGYGKACIRKALLLHNTFIRVDDLHNIETSKIHLDQDMLLIVGIMSLLLVFSKLYMSNNYYEYVKIFTIKNYNFAIQPVSKNYC